MYNKYLSFLLMFVSTLFLVNIPETCLAQQTVKIKTVSQDMPLEKLAAELNEGQQSQTEPDLNTTEKIRQAILNDKSLSGAAYKVKVITFGGKVTLKGSVKSGQEKKSIENLAARIAGESNIINEIVVAP
jgi:osmotically-inducible protein OsmY